MCCQVTENSVEFNYPHMGGPMDCCIHDNIKKTYFDKSARQAVDARSRAASQH